ncbi:Ribonuclease J [uncultured Gammaproteobacteria bacterium]
MSHEGGIHCPGPDELWFLPLGGASEIGLNLNLYGHDGRWLMVDLGIGFADDSLPGIDIVVPDPAFIRERRENLVGLVLTHAHEDHFGAVQYLWPELGCPVYATSFTAEVLRAKLHERGLVGKVPIREVRPGERFKVGPFEIELLRLTHSIPEPNSVVVRTEAGVVLHTGDWKFDPDPLIAPTADYDALQRLGREGLLAVVGDSTNATVPGHSGSEGQVRGALAELFGRFHNRIAVTCFATNVARLESIALAAAAHDRQVALVGRSLWRIYEAARATGYLKSIPDFISEHEAGYIPRDRLVLICTGSQGEPRSALARIATEDHPVVELEAGDAVIYSSREIPGNERAIARVQNLLLKQGIEVVTASDVPVHVSGHPARDELRQLYQWTRPQVLVPVHGELRHQLAHAELARSCGVAQVVIPEDGGIIQLAPGPAKVVGQVQTGRLALDGKRLVPANGAVIKGRRRVMHQGSAVVSLALNGRGELVGAPQVSAIGLLDHHGDRDLVLDICDGVREAIGSLSRSERMDDEVIRRAASGAVRRGFGGSHGKKPVTEVHVIRI